MTWRNKAAEKRRKTPHLSAIPWANNWEGISIAFVIDGTGVSNYSYAHFTMPIHVRSMGFTP